MKCHYGTEAKFYRTPYRYKIPMPGNRDFPCSRRAHQGWYGPHTVTPFRIRVMPDPATAQGQIRLAQRRGSGRTRVHQTPNGLGPGLISPWSHPGAPGLSRRIQDPAGQAFGLCQVLGPGAWRQALSRAQARPASDFFSHSVPSPGYSSSGSSAVDSCTRAAERSARMSSCRTGE